MARQNINIGTAANSGNGDPLRTAFTKANENFTELYNRPVFSGSYADLTNKPALFDGNYNNLTNKPALFDGNYNNLTNKPALFDGNYNNLTNKPTIPADISELTDTQNLLASVGSSDSLVNGEATLSLSDTGVLTLPQGSLIGEMLVTDNPTVVIQPANPEHESQLLYIKGGVPGFPNTENGITIAIQNTLTYQNGDIVYINVYSGLPEGTTLYWWVDEYSPGQEFQPDNGVLTLDEFGSAFFDFTVLDSSLPFRVYVADTLYNAYANNLGAVSLDMNTNNTGVDTSAHLHLTTGDLTQTSIFLGTDNHNVRTKANGSIELTSYDYQNETTYTLNFRENVLRIDSSNSPGDEDLYLKAGDDLYLDALDDDIHIRARDDVRIRPGYDFDNDEYAWQYRFVESSGAMIVSDYDNQYGVMYPIFDEEDNDRGLALESTGSTYIKSEFGNYTWKFGRNGDLAFPDNTIQSTAWTGVPMSPVPSSSLGSVNDIAGLIAADSNYLYYCTADYVDAVWANTAIVDVMGGNGVDSGIAIRLSVPPSVGWKISNGPSVATITAVTPQGDWYVLFWDTPITFQVGDTVVYGPVEPEQQNIWRRVAWSNDTW